MFQNNRRTLCALAVCLVTLTSLAAADDSKKQAAVTTPQTQCSVVFVKHVDCEAAARHVRSLFQGEKETNKATWFAPSKAVLLRASPEEIKQMEYLIAQIDVPAVRVEAPPSPAREVLVMHVQYAPAHELAEMLERIVGSQRRQRARSRGSSSVPSYAVDERTNTIVMLATPGQIEKAKELAKALDVPVDRSKSVAPKSSQTR